MFTRNPKNPILGLVLILAVGCAGRNPVPPPGTVVQASPTSFSTQPGATQLPDLQDSTAIMPSITASVQSSLPTLTSLSSANNGQDTEGESNQVWLNPKTDPSSSALTKPPGDGTLGDQWIRPKDELAIVFVPGGTFRMGSFGKDPLATAEELPNHTVTLNSYWIDRTEVPNSAYNQCVKTGLCTQSRYANNASYNGENLPAVGISWQDAATYCDWVGGRLPFEAEWEYAAKGEPGNLYPWGDRFDGGLLNFCDANCRESWADGSVTDGFEESAPVGSYPEGASWVGALDMAGNVWEWVWDWYSEYTSEDQTNPVGPANGSCKIIRGGCWANGADGVRTTYRMDSGSEISLSTRHANIGFRCVSAIEKSEQRGAAMEHYPAAIPRGNPANIDGTLTSSEWEDARVETFADGSKLLMMHHNGYLYLGIRSNSPGMLVGNIYIHLDNTISILHSSAALGTAIYEKEGESWRQVQAFSWCCRNTSSDLAAEAERTAFLQQDSWMAANARMGNPGELEYQIEMRGETLKLAVTFLRAAEPNEKFPWPSRIVDDCIRPTPGGYPSEMRFNPGSWAVLSLSTETEIP